MNLRISYVKVNELRLEQLACYVFQEQISYTWDISKTIEGQIKTRDLLWAVEVLLDPIVQAFDVLEGVVA